MSKPDELEFPASLVVKGITKRQYFVAMAFQGILAGRRSVLSDSDYGWITRCSIELADKLLSELENNKKE